MAQKGSEANTKDRTMNFLVNDIADEIIKQGKSIGTPLRRLDGICKDNIYLLIEDMCNFLFPARCLGHLPDQSKIVYELKSIETKLDLIITRLSQRSAKKTHSNHRSLGSEVAPLFVTNLPKIQNELIADARYFLEQDPACRSIEEVFICYPGFFALTVYRMAHFLHINKVPILPRMMTEYVHEKTGIDINPGAQIASPCFIDHGTGIVIGETAVIGKRVNIFQGVTLGALSVERNLRGKKRHPTIEENCILYANATILGGQTRIGKNSIIGGNIWVTQSVPENSLLYHEPEIKIRQKGKNPQSFGKA